MSKTSRVAGLLLLTTALVAPYQALAQSSDAPQSGDQGTAAAPTLDSPATQPAEEEVDVSTTGAEIIVTGNRYRNIAKSADQVV